ncbi:hypothetical protein HDN1F_29690 [gamma proteobacterium HdN1]|nr:hypothetical protein HDN1F_29690 [gamma proteobacterium HdN1]
MMSYINLAISVCSLLAAIASALAAWKSATSAKAANALAKEALTKRAQSELFLKVLLELARIHRLMTDFINNDNNDADFSMVFDGKAAAELLPLLKELDALSPKLRAAFKKDVLLADLLERMSSQGYSASADDLMLLQNMIDLLQNSQRKELSNP